MHLKGVYSALKEWININERGNIMTDGLGTYDVFGRIGDNMYIVTVLAEDKPRARRNGAIDIYMTAQDDGLDILIDDIDVFRVLTHY